MIWILGVAACVLMMVFPEITVSATKDAMGIWMNAVVPSLLPFMMIAGYIKKTGMESMSGKSWYPVLMAVLSGYPMGAKLAADQYRDGNVDEEGLHRLLCFAMITGPAFLIGGVGVAFFRWKAAGYILAFSHYAGAFFCGLLLGRRRNPNGKISARQKINDPQSDMPFTDCILESFRTLGIVLAYIVLFMIAAEFADGTGVMESMTEEGKGFCKGLMEMTIGCSTIADSGASMRTRLTLTSFVISFGGMSVMGQTMSMLADCPVRVWQVLHIKLCHGLMSGILTFMICVFVV